jgi:hypothetical protein
MHIMPLLQKGLRMKWIVKCKENNQQKRKKMCMGNLFQKNCYKRFLQKWWCARKIVPWRLGLFDYQKQFANPICGECLT